MKKGFSIFISLLMLTATLQLSVATHFCEGKKIAVKISFSGKMASCGMKCSEMELPPAGTTFTEHCCDNVIASCGIDNNYTPSFIFLPESCQFNFQVPAISSQLCIISCDPLIPLYSNGSPPGVLLSTNVDLSSICNFRI
jgi:hypothetical protein